MNKNLFYKHKYQENIKINELNKIDFSNNNRIKYYIGDFYNQSNIEINLEINVDEKYKVFHQNSIFFYKGPSQIVENFPFHHGVLSPAWWWGYNNKFYVDIPCLTNSADGYNSDELPVLTKTRIINNKYNGILLKYEYEYHWKILETFNDTINFEDKMFF